MKKIIKFLAFLILVFLIYFGYTTYPKLDLISGFSAKSMASGHFIDHRSQDIIEKNDNDIPKIDWAKNTINEEEKFATATVYGLKERKAIYREGLGATLINDDFDVSKSTVFRCFRLAHYHPFLIAKSNVPCHLRCTHSRI